MVVTPKLLLFGILGGLVGYFIFPYITPIYNFARQPSDEWWVRSLATLLGIGLFLAWGSGQFSRWVLIGGTVGFFVGGLLSPFLAVIFVNAAWYQIIEWPKEAYRFTNIVQVSVWTGSIYLGYRTGKKLASAI